MYCLNCGSELPDSAKFCSNCGTQVKANEIVEAKEVVNNVGGASQIGANNTLNKHTSYYQKKLDSKYSKYSKGAMALSTVVFAVILFGYIAIRGNTNKSANSAAQNNKAYTSLDSASKAIKSMNDTQLRNFTYAAQFDTNGAAIACVVKFAPNNDGSVVAKIKVSNANKSSPILVAYTDLSLVDENGKVYPPDNATFGMDNQLPNITIEAGSHTEGYVLFKVPKNENRFIMRYNYSSVPNRSIYKPILIEPWNNTSSTTNQNSSNSNASTTVNNNLNKSNSNTENSQTSSTPITKEKAVEIIGDIIPEGTFAYDHDDTKNGVDYYVMRSLDKGAENKPITMWYYVDKKTGNAFYFDVSNNDFTAMDIYKPTIQTNPNVVPDARGNKGNNTSLADLLIDNQWINKDTDKILSFGDKFTQINDVGGQKHRIELPYKIVIGKETIGSIMEGFKSSNIFNAEAGNFGFYKYNLPDDMINNSILLRTFSENGEHMMVTLCIFSDDRKSFDEYVLMYPSDGPCYLNKVKYNRFYLYKS